VTQDIALEKQDRKAPPFEGRGVFGETAGRTIQQVDMLIHLASTPGLKCRLFRFTL